jgi:hypothetical protein
VSSPARRVFWTLKLRHTLGAFFHSRRQLFANVATFRVAALELLKEAVPSLSRTAVLWNSANPANALAWRDTQGAARALGVILQPHEVQGPKDFEVAFARMAEERLDALFVLDDALTIPYRERPSRKVAVQKLDALTLPWNSGAMSARNTFE